MDGRVDDGLWSELATERCAEVRAAWWADEALRLYGRLVEAHEEEARRMRDAVARAGESFSGSCDCAECSRWRRLGLGGV